MDCKNTETLDRLYLEISQFTKAKSSRELKLEAAIRNIVNSYSFEQQAAAAEFALAEVEDRTPEAWAVDTLDTTGGGA